MLPSTTLVAVTELYNLVPSNEASVDLSKLVWLKYAAAKVTGPTVVRAKRPVPVCSCPSESIATVHGVVNPCLPAVIVVFAIPV